MIFIPTWNYICETFCNGIIANFCNFFVFLDLQEFQVQVNEIQLFAILSLFFCSVVSSIWWGYDQRQRRHNFFKAVDRRAYHLFINENKPSQIHPILTRHIFWSIWYKQIQWKQFKIIFKKNSYFKFWINSSASDPTEILKRRKSDINLWQIQCKRFEFRSKIAFRPST